MDNEIDNARKCKHEIIIENVSNGETLTFSLALLKGHLCTEVENQETCCNNVSVTNNTNSTTTQWPILRSKFKCLVELSVGQNRITLKCCTENLEIDINYKPRRTEYFVTPVYIICKNHDGKFQAPDKCDNSIECACRRIILGSKLIQSLIAEKLFENNFGRKTFQIESDVNNDAEDCIQFYSKLSVEDARSMDQEALWVYFGREIMKSELCSNKRKFLAFLSATYWDGNAKAHAALGGGGLALFGTGCLHTWPERLQDVISCFLDPTPVDTRLLMDDSCFRGTYGGCFSTTLGSVCHELGHTFDLGHSKRGIMGRGFDNIDLVFLPHSHCIQQRKQCMQYTTVQLISKLNVECIISPSSTVNSSTSKEVVNNNCMTVPRTRNRNLGNTEVKKCNDDDKTHWSPSCAALLAYHRGVVMSEAGIRVVELRGENGLIQHSWQFTTSKLRHQLVVPLHLASRAELIVIEDDPGNILKQELKSHPYRFN